jgi:hypothetical protein
MNTTDYTPRLLGIAFLGVVLTSLASGASTDLALGSGGVSDILVHVSDNAGVMRFGVLAGLVNAVGILILATLLYAVLGGHGRTMALVALLCWVGESLFYALNQVAAAGLLGLGTEFMSAGTPASSFYQSLGGFLHDAYHLGGVILMFFYCAGGLLWYWLLFKSRLVPRWLSSYGIAAVAVGLVGAGAALLGNNLGLLPFIAILPFEVVIGLVLLLRGIHAPATSAPALLIPETAQG